MVLKRDKTAVLGRAEDGSYLEKLVGCDKINFAD